MKLRTDVISYSAERTSCKSGIAAWVFCAACILTLPWLSAKPFYSKGEPREAVVAQSMLETGNWVLPRRYSDEVPSKPPFVHWLMAAASLPAGAVSEFSARLPSALFSIAAVFSLYIFLMARTSAELALTSSALLLGAIEWHRAALTCRVDMTLAALLTLSFLSLFRWEERKLRGYPLDLILCTAAATLSKGPVAAILTCAVTFIYLFILRYRLLVIALSIGRILLPSIIVPLVWYLLAYRQGGAQFIDTIWNENVGRMTSNMAEGEPPHNAGVAYLWGMVLLGLMPWTLILACAPVVVCRDTVNALLTVLRSPIVWLRSLSKINLFSAVIIVTFLAFYSIPASKRSVYLLPIYPFLCLALANYLLRLWQAFPLLAWRYCYALALLLAFIYAVAALVHTDSVNFSAYLLRPRQISEFAFLKSTLSGIITENSPVKLFALFIPLISCALVFFHLRENSTPSEEQRILQPVQVTCLIYFSFLVVLNWQVLPAAARGLSAKQFALEVTAAIPLNEQLYSFGERFYGLNFYLSNRLSRIAGAGEAAQGSNILLRESDLPAFEKSIAEPIKVARVLTSKHGIEKPYDTVLLVKISAP